MGMSVTNCWILFCYGVKRDHHDKFISIRGFSERISVDCFNNNVTTDTGALAKNITSLDDIDKKALFLLVVASTIIVLLLEIQISARYRISRLLLFRLLILAIRL